MDFTSFKVAVKNAVESKIGENSTMTINDIKKNNGIILSGLMVKSKDSNVSPIIYLNEYYQAYESGNAEFEAIISDIFEVYEKNKVDHDMDMSQFLNYENIREKIVYKLINSDRNADLLQHIPHIAFHDLSIVFQLSITGERFENATILIRNEHLAVWNVSLDSLYEDACRNTPILNRYEIRDMEDVIREFIPSEEMVQMPISLFVLSNKDRVHGAACILYPDLLKHVSGEIGSSMYIIPSSVHETLLIPAKKVDESKCKYIKDMVSMVNDTQVAEEEILSYSVYFYDRNTDKTIRL